ncbi:MAG TPA: choice-of-anchor Q domain-containing protein, partial [Candidatus Binatia bacterium]|nr:choice-of-anchor Q domain-containing protein [Candidatus Binatia bacterium]
MLFRYRKLFVGRILLTLAVLAGLFIRETVPQVRAMTIVVPDSYTTIQAAINAANPGDTIIVRPGTYSENVTINKPIVLTAESYDSTDPTRNTTIIHARSSRKPVISIPAGAAPMPTVRGFILRNGREGIFISSDAVIEYNYLVGMQDQIDVTGGGGGVIHGNVFFDSGDDAIDLDNMNRSLLIEHNRMLYSRDDGIEVRLQDATAPVQPITITFRNNEIIGCSEDGIQFIDYGQTVDTQRIYFITGNVIANSVFSGIGLMGNASSVEDYSGADIQEAIRVYNNTIYGNNYGISGGDNLIAYNNIIANSTTRGVWRVQGFASLVAYTLFYNNGLDAEQSTLGGFNRFGQNPLFAYAPHPGPDGVWKTVDDDFRGLAILPGSPAIDVGYGATCPAIDVLGTPRPYGAHCDLGAFEYNGTVPTPPPDPLVPPI